MEVVFVLGLLLVAGAGGEDTTTQGVAEQSTDVDAVDNDLANTELVLVFVIFRHGDRTPDQEELDLYPNDEKQIKSKLLFPFGMKALTNKGKQRSFIVGKYLRHRYDNFVSRLYIPDEVAIRTTEFARTKMTVLCALAALYPPPPAQKWNPALDWQPVPYDTLPYDDDDLLYWYNCPRYIWLKNQLYENPEVKRKLRPNQDLYQYTSKMTSTNITNPEDVFYLDNLFQTLENVGVRPPKWANEVMPEIKQMTKLEYAIQFYNSELIRLATGVLMTDILNATNAAVDGDLDQPKLRLYSAHENNVAALMAAAKVFQPHQPNFGATFSLELRRNRLTGQYGITAVYAPNAGGPGNFLRVSGCSGFPVCDYDEFVNLTQENAWSYEEFQQQCPKLT